MQVQELVGIVPWTFIAQICNLFLQMYLIKRFLFKPVNEMLQKTSTVYAPWTVIEGNDKKFARIKALKTINEAIENSLE